MSQDISVHGCTGSLTLASARRLGLRRSRRKFGTLVEDLEGCLDGQHHRQRGHHSVADGSNFDYTINLTNSNTSTSAIVTSWYAWVPGQDFLP